jgi:hypothetical protein
MTIGRLLTSQNRHDGLLAEVASQAGRTRSSLQSLLGAGNRASRQLGLTNRTAARTHV